MSNLITQDYGVEPPLYIIFLGYLALRKLADHSKEW